MRRIDLNSDMGEGMPHDEALMQCISSTNIACGYHAGNEETMLITVELAILHRVAIGAHPSYPDREHFGRQNQVHSPEAVFEIVSDQLELLSVITKRSGGSMAHVKPHGALYNMAAANERIAEAIARAIRNFDPTLMLFGLAGSQLILAGRKAGLKTINEVFADRSYQADGSLTPRDQMGALISDSSKAASQVLQMIEKKTVQSFTGKEIPIIADTVCIHGDGPHALEHAKRIRSILEKNKIRILAPAMLGEDA